MSCGEPRVASVFYMYDRNPERAQDVEQVFYALLVASSDQYVKDLKQWAAENE